MGSKKPLFWAIMTIVLEMVVIALFVPASFMNKLTDIERDWMAGTYTQSTINWLDKKTDSVHYTLTRSSGIADGLQWMFFPSEEAKRKEGAMSRLGNNLWFPYLKSRGEALDGMIKALLMRIWSVIIWTPLLVIIAVPAFFDGVMERRIKQHTFKYPSPFLYRYGVRASLLVGFIIIAATLSPIPVPPLLLPIALMLTIITTSMLVVSNLPKRI